MGQKIKYIATIAMDDYYQQYQDGTSFFTLDDFIQRCGNVAADFYRQQWKVMYDELRQERRDEVVGFEPSVLSEQIVKLEKEGIGYVGNLEKPAMSLPYDKQSSGFSNVFDASSGIELERSNVNEMWQYPYQPYTNRRFFVIDREKIRVFAKSNVATKSVRILYVPFIAIGDGEAELPDGMVNYTIMTVVAQMRALADRPIKMSVDGNPNQRFETEFNKEAVK